MIALSMRLAIIRALRHALAIPLCAGVVKLVDTSDSKFSSDFVFQVKNSQITAVPE